MQTGLDIDNIRRVICEMQCNILYENINKQELIEHESFKIKENNDNIQLHVYGYNIKTNKYHIYTEIILSDHNQTTYHVYGFKYYTIIYYVNHKGNGKYELELKEIQQTNFKENHEIKFNIFNSNNIHEYTNKLKISCKYTKLKYDFIQN